MLHSFFKWRYERRSRAGAFKLPRGYSKTEASRSNLGDFMARQSSGGRGFRHYDLPRRRRRWTRAIALLLGTLLFLWITYESIIALIAMGK